MLSRNPEKHPNCEVSLPEINNNSDIDEIFNDYKISDFKLVGYTSDEAINVEMLAPNEKR